MTVPNHLERYRRFAELDREISAGADAPDAVRDSHFRCEQLIVSGAGEAGFLVSLGDHLSEMAQQWGVGRSRDLGVWNLFGGVPAIGAQRSVGIYLRAHASSCSDGARTLVDPGTHPRQARCALLLRTERWVYDFLAAIVEEAAVQRWPGRPARLSEWFDVTSSVEVDYLEGLWTHRHDSPFRDLERTVAAARRLAGAKNNEAPVIRPGTSSTA